MTDGYGAANTAFWTNSVLPQRIFSLFSFSVAHTEWAFLNGKMSIYLQTIFAESRLSVLGLTSCLSFKRASLTNLFFVAGDNTGQRGYMTDDLQQNSYYLVRDCYHHLNNICILLQIRRSLGVSRWWWKPSVERTDQKEIPRPFQ